MATGIRIFTDDEVRTIRGSPATAAELAKYYNCGPETIRRVRRRETYFHVPDAAPISPEEIDASLERLISQVAEGDGKAGKAGKTEAGSLSHPGCIGEGCPICAKRDQFLRKGEK